MGKHKKLRNLKIQVTPEPTRPILADDGPAAHPWFHLVLVAALTAFGFLLYFHTLGFEFVWDDQPLVAQNENIRNLHHVPSYFREVLAYGSEFKVGVFRPIQELSYALDYRVWGLNPSGYHLSNLLLHILAGLMLYALVYLLSRRKILSFLTALFFLAHPVGVIMATYVAARADTLALIAGFLCFSFYLLSTTSRGIKFISYLILSWLFYLLGMLSKESAIFFPAVIACYEFFCGKRRSWKTSIGTLLSYLPPLALYAFIRTLIQHPIVQTTVKPLALDQRSLMLPKTLSEYFLMLVFPSSGTLHMEYLFGPSLRAMEDPGYFVYFIFAGLLLAGVYFLSKNSNRLILFGFIWFFANLLPVLNLFKKLNAPLAVHWLYAPIAGFLLSMLLSLESSIERSKSNLTFKRGIFYAVLAFFLVYFCAQTVSFSATWKDDVTLYRYTEIHAPTSLRISNNLGVALQKKGYYQEAYRCFQSLLRDNPDHPDIKNNLEALLAEMRSKGIPAETTAPSELGIQDQI